MKREKYRPKKNECEFKRDDYCKGWARGEMVMMLVVVMVMLVIL